MLCRRRFGAWYSRFRIVATDPELPPSIGSHVEIISDDDILSREIIYSNAFEGDVVSSNALLQFKGGANSDGSYAESLALMRLTVVEILHANGCKRSIGLNDRVRANRIRKELPPEPVAGIDRKYYCGLTKAIARNLRISGNNYYIEVVHEREDGYEHHVAIYLRPAIAKKVLPNDRTEAGRLLALAFAGPISWVCDFDQADPAHPVKHWGDQVLIIRDP